MPKKLEKKLKAQGKRRGMYGEQLDRYVYGTLRATGWTPKRRKGTKKGRNQ